MADRVSASITIGGTLSAPDFDALCEIISAEGLSIEWEGEPFAPDHHVRDEPLNLFAHEVAGGQFDTLEAWCAAHSLPFVRWCGSYSGQWGPERVVFTGVGDPKSYAVSEDDVAMIDLETIERLGTLEAVVAYFAAANFTVPALAITVAQAEGAAHVE